MLSPSLQCGTTKEASDMETHYYLKLFGPEGSCWDNGTDFSDLEDARLVARRELESGAAVRVQISDAAGGLIEELTS